jgi:hypothetical protein
MQQMRPAATWWESRDRVKRFEGEDEVLVTLYENYQTFDGCPIARKVTSQRDGKLAYTKECIDFKVATPSESAFAKP